MSDAISIRVSHNGYKIPNRHDVWLIASGRTIVCTDYPWVQYMTIVHDLMLAGF